MSRPIATKWDRLESFLLPSLRSALSVPVDTVRPATLKPYEGVVIAVNLGQRVTPISRYARIRVQGWSINNAGNPNRPAAQRLVLAVAEHLESLIPDGDPIIAASLDVGPDIVNDSDSGLDHAYGVILAEIHAA